MDRASKPGRSRVLHLRRSCSRPAGFPVVRDQSLVGQPFPGHAGNHRPHLVDGVGVPDVVPPIKFVDIALQVFRADLVVDALVPALQGRPKALHPVDMGHAANVLAGSMAHCSCLKGMHL